MNTMIPAIAVQDDIDLRALMLTQRNALLMQVRWIESYGEASPIKDFLVALRRSNLEIVREIERELGMKSKRKLIRRHGNG